MKNNCNILRWNAAQPLALVGFRRKHRAMELFMHEDRELGAPAGGSAIRRLGVSHPKEGIGKGSCWTDRCPCCHCWDTVVSKDMSRDLKETQCFE